MAAPQTGYIASKLQNSLSSNFKYFFHSFICCLYVSSMHMNLWFPNFSFMICCETGIRSPTKLAYFLFFNVYLRVLCFLFSCLWLSIIIISDFCWMTSVCFPYYNMQHHISAFEMKDILTSLCLFNIMFCFIFFLKTCC